MEVAATVGIRPADGGDAGAIADVHVRSWQHAYRGQMPDSVLNQLDRSERADRWKRLIARPNHVVRVAVRAESVVGFLSMIPSRDDDAAPSVGEIGALYVDPSFWRDGVGRALIESALSVAAEVGYGSLTLWVLESNARARDFYEAMRFVADGASKIDHREGYALAEVRYRLTTGRGTPPS